MLNRRSMLVVAGLVLAGFAGGLVKLFELRYRSGEVYPAYSSLRAGPMGCKALYESMSRLPEYRVELNLQPLRYRHSMSNATVMLQGQTLFGLFKTLIEQAEQIEGLLERDNRLVFTFKPTERLRRTFSEDEESQMDGSAGRDIIKQLRNERLRRLKKNRREELDEPLPEAPPEEEPDAGEAGGSGSTDRTDMAFDSEGLRDEIMESMQDTLSFGRVGFEELPEAVNLRMAEVRDPALRAMGERTIPWNSTMVFREFSDDWTVIAERDGHPVIVELAMPTGSVVVCSDSYFLSNEALLAERRPALVLRLMGENRHIVFDETHLGVARKPGVANLIGRYHLQGLVVGLLGLAALLIWRNASSLIPLSETAPGHGAIEGKDHAAGMINLLRRNIGGNRVFETCVGAWRSGRLGSVRGARRRKVEAWLDDSAQQEKGRKLPLQAYREFQRLLNDRS